MKKCSDDLWFCLCVSFIALAVFGCAEEATDDGVSAAQCVQNDLVAQCPPNTVAQLSADSEAVCNQSTSIDVDGLTSSGEGEITDYCVGTAECKLVCELAAPCTYGVERVSPADGVICYIPQGGCGDGTCEAGENPQSCPQDCASNCTPNSSRCTQGQLERCTPRGEWEMPIDCEEGSSCTEDGDGTASCVGDE